MFQKLQRSFKNISSGARASDKLVELEISSKNFSKVSKISTKLQTPKLNFGEAPKPSGDFGVVQAQEISSENFNKAS